MCVNQAGRRGKTGDLSREISQAVSLAAVTTNCEKSANAIVGRAQKPTEGQNNVAAQGKCMSQRIPDSGNEAKRR